MPPEIGALGADATAGFDGGGGGGGSSLTTVAGEGVCVASRWCGNVVEVFASATGVAILSDGVAFADGEVVVSERVVFRATWESSGSPLRIKSRPTTMAESPKMTAPRIQGSAFDLRAAGGAVVSCGA
jgi:hypothetical protein